MGNGQTRMLRALQPTVNGLLIEATGGRYRRLKRPLRMNPFDIAVRLQPVKPGQEQLSRP